MVVEDVTLPKRFLSEVPVSALAAEAESAIQIAVPAPATMTERRMLVARGNTRVPFISTPPGSREPMVAFILGRRHAVSPWLGVNKMTNL